MKTVQEKSYISKISLQDGLYFVINTLNNWETVSRVFPSKTFKTEKGAERYAKRFLEFSLVS